MNIGRPTIKKKNNKSTVLDKTNLLLIEINCRDWPKPLLWFWSNTKPEIQNGWYFWADFKEKILVPDRMVYFFRHKRAHETKFDANYFSFWDYCFRAVFNFKTRYWVDLFLRVTHVANEVAKCVFLPLKDCLPWRVKKQTKQTRPFVFWENLWRANQLSKLTDL